MLIFAASCRLLRTLKIEQLLQFSVNSNSVQSTVTNDKSIQQTVIDLVPMMSNPRITLFPYSNILKKLTIHFYGTNNKNWNSALYWRVMFNSCNKYGVYFLLTLFILLLSWWININSSFILNLFLSWLNMS